ncbi:lipopolysaccharide biosynthesis protein [Pseudomonas soli]|uniref:lipopolysaccharide biosynthesis protein n=1 Tax=Pseudomonas soli TaxID=1306993 RepID=UPI0028A5B44D|nr:lipopolysaccharide biosynthesis protein [Pseudomonas soli]
MAMVKYFYRLSNVALRGLTLVSKFGLLLFLAKYLAPEDVGLYGLMLATIAYCTYPLGFEFYVYSTREIIKLEKNERGRALRNQLALHARLYILAVPLFLLIFHFEFLSWQMAPWFFVLVFLEHACQEMMRMLVALEKQLVASIVLFIRQGLWALVLIALMSFDETYRHLSYVLIGWVTGAAVAATTSAIVLGRMLAFRKFMGEAVDWRWVKVGLKIAIPMFVGTVFLNFVTIVDKYWFESLQGREMLGGYIFFMSISAAMMSFLEAGVFSFMYPSIVAAYHNGDISRFKACLRKLLFQTVGLSVVFIVGIVIFIDWFLELLQREVYSSMKGVLYIFLLAMFFQALSYIPHYALYAQNKDRAIIAAHIFSVPVFALSVWLLTSWNELYAVPVGCCLAYVSMLVVKCLAHSCFDLKAKVASDNKILSL